MITISCSLSWSIVGSWIDPCLVLINVAVDLRPRHHEGEDMDDEDWIDYEGIDWINHSGKVIDQQS